MKRNVKARSDARIVEACEGRGINIDEASPMQLVEAYAAWVLGDGAWARVIIDAARNAGVKL